jgi:hypothetical protein
MVTVMTGRAVNAQAKEPEDTPEGSLAAEVAVLRAEVRRIVEARDGAPAGAMPTVHHT